MCIRASFNPAARDLSSLGSRLCSSEFPFDWAWDKVARRRNDHIQEMAPFAHTDAVHATDRCREYPRVQAPQICPVASPLAAVDRTLLPQGG
jgi:hypothetical protein